MTKEYRAFISPVDILGVEYECGHCHAKILVSVNGFQRVLYQCPNCKEGMASAMQASDVKAKDDVKLEQFVKALAMLKETDVTIRLEIKDEG